MTILYFKDFVFPLFASGQGSSEVGIGQTLLFSGAISILIGPSLSAVLLKRLGAKGTNIAMGALFAGGLLLFSFMPTLFIAVIVVFILTIAGCVGLVAQGVYFSAIRACKAYGAGRSMGVYSLFDNLSQTAGPLLFGAALILGYSMAGLLIGIAAAVLLMLFAAVGERDKGENR
jgi:predicted MFS family arabinose efflux permease